MRSAACSFCCRIKAPGYISHRWHNTLQLSAFELHCGFDREEEQKDDISGSAVSIMSLTVLQECGTYSTHLSVFCSNLI